MAWPSGTKASTTNVDAGTDSITSARADIKQNIDNVNEIITHLNITSPSDGDVLKYSSSSSKWEQVASTTLSGNNSLVIPFGGYVVNKWSGDSGFDSSGFDDRERKYRMATLGGAYYDTSIKGTTDTSDLTLVSAESVLGTITGASVTRATPTLHKPTGYSITGSNNFSVNITNGILGIGSSSPYTVSTFTHNGDVGIVTNAAASSVNVMYVSGYDNYVTLPAGDYMLSVKSSTTTLVSGYGSQSGGVEADTDTIAPISNASDFWIYNKTDDIEITTSDDNSPLEMLHWGTDVIKAFTLTGTKDIQFFASANKSGSVIGDNSTTPQESKDYLGFWNTTAPSLSGDVNNTSYQNYFWDDGSTALPAKLGWYDDVADTYIVITKL